MSGIYLRTYYIIYTTRVRAHRNGVCDTACDGWYCNYDFGDCNQLCDFEECTVTGWTNGPCDSNCNTTECEYDGYDCGGLECADSRYCNQLLVDNGWCESGCKNDSICGVYEEEFDCSECIEGVGCGLLYYTFFEPYAGDDDYIDENDIENNCDSFNLLLSLYESVIDYNLSCYNIAYNPIVDVNTNGKIGFNEFVEMVIDVFLDSGYDFYTAGHDCSICLYNSSKYYI